MNAILSWKPAGACLAVELLHQHLALLADAAGGLAVGDAALDALALPIAQLRRLRVAPESDRAPQLLWHLLLYHTSMSAAVELGKAASHAALHDLAVYLVLCSGIWLEPKIYMLCKGFAAH